MTKRSWFIFLLVMLFFSWMNIKAQEPQVPPEQVLRIIQFAGLNTRDGDFTVQPGEFRQLDNWDLNANPGSLTPTLGFDNQGTVSGIDSIIGIFGAYFSDGRQRLFYVVDSAGVGWGEIRATPMNSISGSQTQVKRKWPVIGKPKFTIFQDKVYVVNGNGRGIVYDNKSARDFPTYASCEPTITPLKTSGNLNGEYVYIFRVKSGISSGLGAAGYPTQRVKVQNGQILLENFSWLNAGMWDSSPDSIRIRIYRTKANPGILDEGDTAYWVGTDITATSASNLATKSFTDNIADGSLNTDTSQVVIELYRVGYGAIPASGMSRYGSPWRITDGSYAAGDSGVLLGMPGYAWGYAYAMTVLDTITNMESELGPPFYWQRQAGFDSNLVGLPALPSGLSGYRKNLYRSLVVYARWDTTWQTFDVSGNAREQAQKFLKLPRGRKCIRQPDGSYKCYLSEQPVYDPGGKKDSVYNLGQYYLLAQLSSSDSLYGDRIGQDSISSNFENLYNVSVPLSPMENIVSLEDRLFASYGSTVAISDLDTASRWFIFNRASVSAQDGQRITAIWGQRDALRIGKTESLHNFYQTADTIWNLSEVTQHFGVIAPNSVAQGLGGTYYYTDYGVVRESEGLYRDRQFSTDLISQKVSALDTIPVSQKQDAEGIWHDQMYMLSLPSVGDSGQMYVYFERANAWARWPNLCFGGATHYSTETALSFLPGDTLYFFKPGGSIIYRWGVGNTYDNARIPLVAETAPILTEDMRFNKSITELGVGLRTTATDSLIFTYKDHEGATAFTDTLSVATDRYNILGGRGNALYWTIRFTNPSNDTWGNTIIDRFDIYYNQTAKERVR